MIVVHSHARTRFNFSQTVENRLLIRAPQDVDVLILFVVHGRARFRLGPHAG